MHISIKQNFLQCRLQLQQFSKAHSFALLNLTLVKRSNVGGTASEPINPPVGTV